ncbi:MAG: L-threonylcarbamoyladenylate synthase [Pseudomonadota bacterium]
MKMPLKIAAETLRAGGVVAYPTEGVFGLGCDPFDASAVARILDIKHRRLEAGLIVIGDSLAQLAPLLAPLPDALAEQAAATWPGAVTWVMPASDEAPHWITGGRDTVAVRVPGHARARQLCTLAGTPLVSTSANRSGRPALRSALAVRRHLREAVDCIVPGAVVSTAGASEIRDAQTGHILRER